MFVLVSVSSSPDYNHFKENCSSQFYCGTQEVQHPFWTEDGTKECCRPGMAIKCENNHLEIEVMSGWYRILSITQETRTLKVERTHSRDDACDKKLADDINHGLIGEVRNCSDGSFEYHCSSHGNSGQKFTCNKSGMANEFFSVKGPILKGIIQLSKDSIAIQGQHGYAEVVRRFSEVFSKPFELEYEDDGGDCYSRLHSDGSCGHNWTSQEFTCFCSDHPRPQNCLARGRSSLKLVLGASAAGIGILILLALCIMIKFNKSLMFWKKQTGNHPNVEVFLRNHESLAPKRYRYSDVKKMTNSFKDKLGEGGYGGVYKGKMVDGQMVAVKVLSETKGNGEEFINEVASISKTSHVNIVTLLGFCYEGPKRALIYEFMANGSLEKFIYNGNPSTNGRLGWETLYNIAIGIARGLEYLHRGCNTRIVHFDIKPHNILLNEDFCPKVSDFGLAKLCTKKESMISMFDARGTPGYIAPEVFYRSLGGVSYKSDVYSYGVMVLEMVGGRKNIDVGVDRISEIYFPHWIYNHLELDELGLQGLMSEEDRVNARKMIIVSLWCIQTKPSDRPPMCRVLDMLEGSLQSLPIPPKPFLFSPARSMKDSSTTLEL